MKYDTFSFFNQQLSSMLRQGVPLEGALRQLSHQMERGQLREEIEALEKDLQAGVPPEKALASRKLPDFYVRMVQLGMKGQDLPSMLSWLASYYTQVNSLWTRLRGLVVYPLIVLVLSLGLSLWFAFLYNRVPLDSPNSFKQLFRMSQIINVPPSRPGPPKPTGSSQSTGPSKAAVVTAPSKSTAAPTAPTTVFTRPLASQMRMWMNLWMPPAIVSLTLVTGILILSDRRSRAWMRWRMPGFREASLSEFASSMSLLLRNGASLTEASGILRQLEARSVLATELQRWEEKMALGESRISEMAGTKSLFPPLFLWIVTAAGEELAEGFRQAAEIYHARALRRTEVLLNTVLPGSLVVLGFMLMGQIYPFMTSAFDFFTPIFHVSDLF